MDARMFALAISACQQYGRSSRLLTGDELLRGSAQSSALRLFDRMLICRVSPDAGTQLDLLYSCKVPMPGGWLRALQVFGVVQGNCAVQQPHRKFYGALAAVLSWHGRWQHALQVLDELGRTEDHDVRRKVRVLHAVYCGLIQGPWWGIQNEFVDVFEARRRFVSEHAHVLGKSAAQPSLRIYEKAQRNCEEAYPVPLWENSLEWLRELREHRVGPGSVLPGAVRSCAKASQWESACHVIEDCRIRGRRPSKADHHAVALAAKSVGQWAVATQLMLPKAAAPRGGARPGFSD